jgi:hypothetical protein
MCRRKLREKVVGKKVEKRGNSGSDGVLWVEGGSCRSKLESLRIRKRWGWSGAATNCYVQVSRAT